jgi:hypothetical protein
MSPYCISSLFVDTGNLFSKSHVLSLLLVAVTDRAVNYESYTALYHDSLKPLSQCFVNVALVFIPDRFDKHRLRCNHI